MKKLIILLALLLLPALMGCDTAEASNGAKTGLFYDNEKGCTVEQSCQGVYRYTRLPDGTARIDKVTPHKAETSLVLPEVLDGYDVTELDGKALTDEKLRIVQEIVMPASITRVQSADDPYGAKGLRLPRQLKKITFVGGESHFALEDGLLYLNDELVGCISSQVKDDVVLRSGTKIVDMGVLQECEGITSLSFPATMERLDMNRAMLDEHFPDLTAFIVEEGNPEFSSQDGVLYYRKALWSCPRKLQTDVLRVKEGTRTISKHAFRDCDGIGAVEFPNGLEWIAGESFYSCGALTRLRLPASVHTIDEGAFCYCWSISEVELDEGNENYTMQKNLLVEKAGRKIIAAFDSGEAVVTIPEDILAIGKNAFTCCGTMSSVRLNEGLTCIGDEAFAFTALTEVELPAGLTTLGEGAFHYCEKLKTISFAQDRTALTEIPAYCFSGADITTLAFPAGNKITSIGEMAYGGCGELTHAVLPNELKSMGEWAFSSCKKLETLVLPQGLKSVGSWAFSECEKLKEVILPSTVTTVGTYAFSDCKSLQKLVLPQKLGSIALSVVNDCKALKTLVIPPNTWLKEEGATGSFKGRVVVHSVDSPAQKFCNEKRIDSCLLYEIPFLTGPLYATASDDGKISGWLNSGARIKLQFEERGVVSCIGHRSGRLNVVIEAADGSVAEKMYACTIEEGLLEIDENWTEMRVDENGAVTLVNDQWTLTFEGAAA